MSWSRYLFSFDGRVPRARMWLFYVVAWAMEMVLFLGILLTYAILFATGLVGRDTDPLSRHATGPGIGLVVVLAVFFVAIYYMYLAVTAKRLHDRNRSAWWILVFLLAPTLLIFAPEIVVDTKALSMHDPRADIAIFVPMLAGVALTVWGFVELYCLRGTIGDNRYGRDPLAGRL